MPTLSVQKALDPDLAKRTAPSRLGAYRWTGSTSSGSKSVSMHSSRMAGMSDSLSRFGVREQLQIEFDELPSRLEVAHDPDG